MSDDDHRESEMSDKEGSGSEYCDLDDLPYSSPSEYSENDDELIDMDFSEFCMDENKQTSSTSDTNDDVNASVSSVQQERDGKDVNAWCRCGHCTPCTQPTYYCINDQRFRFQNQVFRKKL